MDYKIIANEGHTIGANLDDGRLLSENASEIISTVPTKMKLIKHYLPSAWGIAFILPALLVPPSYRESIGFHISLTVAWLYWIFAMYQIENTFKKLAPDSSVLPKRAWLVSLVIGSHPTNYVLLFMASLLSTFKGTPLCLLLVIAAPLLLIASFSWYLSIFSSLRRFVNSYLPDTEHVSRFPEVLISLGLGVPAVVCFASQIFGQNLGWTQMSLVPIGIAISTLTIYWMQDKIGLALLQERKHILEDTALDDWCGPTVTV